MEGDELKLTQEFIAEKLGTRRAGVSEAASILQSAGLIRYSRGNITVMDREGLEEFACECYGVVKAEYDRLLGAVVGRNLPSLTTTTFNLVKTGSV